MTEPSSNQDGILEDLLSMAAEYDADGLDIEYKDGFEDICAMKGSSGIGIASIESSSEAARQLRDCLHAVGKKGRMINTAAGSCRIKVTTYDSFGETAYRVGIKWIRAT